MEATASPERETHLLRRQIKVVVGALSGDAHAVEAEEAHGRCLGQGAFEGVEVIILRAALCCLATAQSNSHVSCNQPNCDWKTPDKPHSCMPGRAEVYPARERCSLSTESPQYTESNYEWANLANTAYLSHLNKKPTPCVHVSSKQQSTCACRREQRPI